jgi:Fic/DOC family
MHKLLDWFKVEQDKIKRQEKDALPAPRLAFEFHLRFLTIHPFYDGNGRVGRILLNLILISMGYPPIIVTKEDKPKYNDLLTEIQLNGGSRNDLWVFLGRLLIRSLELVKRAIDGEELLEIADAKKRLAFIKSKISQTGGFAAQPKILSRETIERNFKDWLAEFLRDISIQSMELKDFFHALEFKISHFDYASILSRDPRIVRKSTERTVSDPNQLTEKFFIDFLADIPNLYGQFIARFTIMAEELKSRVEAVSMEQLYIEITFDGEGYELKIATINILDFESIDPKITGGKYGSLPKAEELNLLKEYAFHLQVDSLERGLGDLGLLE